MDERLLEERLKLVWNQTPQAILGALACVVAMLVVQWGIVNPELLLCWSAMAVLALAIRFVLYRRFQAGTGSPHTYQWWSNVFNITLLANGMIWGTGGILLVTRDSLANTVFVAFLLGGISTGSALTFAAFRYASLRFFVPVMLPFSIATLPLGGTVDTTIALMMFVYMGVLWVVSGTSFKAVDASLRLRLDLQEARRAEAAAADRIQQMLLFGPTPRELVGASLSAQIVTARDVSGDFYDIYRHSESCFDILVGDVMGKGIPAAMIGAAAKSRFLRALTQIQHASGEACAPEPEQIVRFVHGRLTNQLSALESFVTAIFVRFDLESGVLTYVNCGHTEGILCRGSSGELHRLESRHTPFGFDPGEEYAQSTLPLAEGDLIFLFSDGVVEARNAEGEQFGLRRLEQLIIEIRDRPPDAITGIVRHKVRSFSGDRSAADDQTCVAVSIGGKAGSERMTVSLEITSDPSNLKFLRDGVRKMCEAAMTPPPSEERIAGLVLAVTEAATNIMRHAYGGRTDGVVRALVEMHGRDIVVRLSHFGEGMSPTTAATRLPEVFAEGGRGMYVIEQSVDGVVYANEEDGGTSITLTKRMGA